MKNNSSSQNKTPHKRMFMNVRQRQRMSYRLALLAASSLMLVIATGLFVYFQFGKSISARAAANGDYRSKTSGNWSTAGTWEKYNGSTWATASAAPSSSDKVIEILSGHTVTVTGAATVDQVLIDAGGTVILNSGITLTIANGTGTDFDVSGTFKNAGTVTINSSASVAFESGGKYQHNFTTTAGTIPTATWNTGSTCEMIGYTTNTTAPSGLQSFYNFIWNCTSQTGNIGLGGGLTTINGDFTLTSTGSGSAELSLASSTSTLSIAGNYNQTGGILSVQTGNGKTGTINVSGDWTHTGGTIKVGGNSSTNAQIVFNKSGTQNFTASGNTVSGNVDFTIANGSILAMGTNILSSRNFTLSSGGGIIIGSTAGITSSGATGNIQSTGTRSFSTSADYTYNGSSAQNTGNGLPSTINSLTLNNSSGLTLTNTVAASSSLTLTSGKITTGSNEMRVTNSSSSAISYSSSNYVIGNLRLTVTSSGTFYFPIGTTSNYELLTLTLNSASGISTVLGTFTNANPVNSSYPLTGVVADEASIDSMLDYGYWTLTPNNSMSSGSFDLKAAMTGYSNVISAVNYYPILKRTNSTSSWAETGNDQAFKYSNGTLTGNKTGFTSFGDFGIGFGPGPPILSFDNHALISGTDNTVGAVYLIQDVGMGLDAWITITDFTDGASLSEFDNNTSGNGYDDAWQPFINVAGHDTSSVGFKITFKIAGTSTDTVVPKIVFAAIDIDGDGSSLKEFVTAYKPFSISYSPTTLLNITNSNGNFTATAGTVNSIANIDTSHTEAMFKVTYTNVNYFLYRIGAINTGSAQVRQASLYFKSFYTLPTTVLPIELIYFKAQLNSHVVDLSWATATETNNQYFTIERSANGKDYTELLRKPGAGNSTHTLYYRTSDDTPLPGYSYYRLKQTDYDGKFAYSSIRPVKNADSENSSEAEISIDEIFPNPFDDHFSIRYTSLNDNQLTFTLMSPGGALLYTKKNQVQKGFNEQLIETGNSLSAGTYIVSIYSDKGIVSRKLIKK